MTDFAKISLATDRVRPSRKPETWAIGGFVTVSVALGLAMLIEALLCLAFAWSRFGLATDDKALCAFSFLTLLYFAAFSIVSARERRWFWESLPSKTLVAALAAEMVVGTVLTFVGIGDFTPLPWKQTLVLFCYAMLCCLGVNDLLKVGMMKHCVPGGDRGPSGM